MIIHRDLKYDNFMLDLSMNDDYDEFVGKKRKKLNRNTKFKVVLIDLGLCKDGTNLYVSTKKLGN